MTLFNLEAYIQWLSTTNAIRRASGVRLYRDTPALRQRYAEMVKA